MEATYPRLRWPLVRPEFERDFSEFLHEYPATQNSGTMEALMSDVMVVVRQGVFEFEKKSRGRLAPQQGHPLPWKEYESTHPLLDRYLEDGDRMFLVTARPGGRLWLMAVYENVRKRHSGWFAPRPNRVPILDITSLRSKLRFHSGNGLTKDDARLGNSLQNPRKLTQTDIAHLEAALKKAGAKFKPAKRIPLEEEVDACEGERIKFEIERYNREPILVRARLRKDGNRCLHCGFGVETDRFRSNLAAMSRVVHVHHVCPLKDGQRRTRLDDLITLCPTCHAVAHALATSLDTDLVTLALLRKHYRPPVTA